jgi:hypothetical protein
MTIFGIRIMRERTYQAEHEYTVRLLTEAEKQIDAWKAKYYYANARAIVAEQFQRKTVINVRPKGVRVGIELEVGHKSETEIREA